jgi:hypothetical protein
MSTMDAFPTFPIEYLELSPSLPAMESEAKAGSPQ